MKIFKILSKSALFFVYSNKYNKIWKLLMKVKKCYNNVRE